MDTNTTKMPWVEVLPGIAFFFLWAIILIVGEIPPEWGLTDWINSFGGVLVILLVILLPAGVGIGWVLRFPHWSYAYLLSTLLLEAYLARASTPGLQFLGYPIFGRELWGWRAWVPLFVSLLIAVLVSRSMQPIEILITNVLRDPALVTYSLFGLMPLLFFAFFDEMDRLFSLYFMVTFAVVSVAATGFYLRSPNVPRGLIALLLGTLCSIVLLIVGPYLYSSSRAGANPVPSIIFGVVLATIMTMPVLSSFLGSSSHNEAV